MEVLTAEEEQLLADSFSDDCRRAAEAIRGADLMLLATGAGMSAESGLPVYKDIADVEVYRKRGLTYAHLCRTTWLEEEPEVFYGFWGVCWNDYKEAEPHLGYQIVRRWKEHWFTAAADGDKRKKRIYQLLCEREKHYAEKIFIEGEVQDAEEPFETLGVDENGLHTLFYSLEQNTEYSQSEQMRTEQQPVQPLGRPFFIFTSNVDGHHQKAGFSPSEVYEIHGSISEWQCSVPCTDELWALPKNFSFTVDRHQMEALPDFPKCIHCDAPARPACTMTDAGTKKKKVGRDILSGSGLHVTFFIPHEMLSSLFSKLVVAQMSPLCAWNLKSCWERIQKGAALW